MNCANNALITQLKLKPGTALPDGSVQGSPKKKFRYAFFPTLVSEIPETAQMMTFDEVERTMWENIPPDKVEEEMGWYGFQWGWRDEDTVWLSASPSLTATAYRLEASIVPASDFAGDCGFEILADMGLFEATDANVEGFTLCRDDDCMHDENLDWNVLDLRQGDVIAMRAELDNGKHLHTRLLVLGESEMGTELRLLSCD